MGDVAQRKLYDDLETIAIHSEIIRETLDFNSILRAQLNDISHELMRKIHHLKIDLAPKIREYEGLRLKTLELENTRNKLVIEINELLKRSGLNENTVFEEKTTVSLHPNEENIMHLKEVVLRLRERRLAIIDAHYRRLLPGV